jgi:hypothetical protein
MHSFLIATGLVAAIGGVRGKEFKVANPGQFWKD